MNGLRRKSELMLSTIVVAVAAAACSHMKPFSFQETQFPRPASLPESIARIEPPLAHLLLAQEDDYVVRIVAGEVTCSGTLIAEDRVLTAHHCISTRGADGLVLPRDVEPSTIRVELGGDYLPWGEVGVRALVAPPCGYAAGKGDIAVLVLERRLHGVTTLPPNLDYSPVVGDEVNPIGFGRCALSRDGIKRQQRDGGPVTVVATDRFELTASICPGDSGGPGISESGKLVGLVSASAMDGSDRTQEPSEFTRLDRWRSVFGQAKAIAEGVAAAELPPLDCDPHEFD